MTSLNIIGEGAQATVHYFQGLADVPRLGTVRNWVKNRIREIGDIDIDIV